MLTWKAHAGPVYDLAFTPDGRQLVTSGNEAIRLWELASRSELREWTSGYRTPVAISPDGKLVGAGGSGEVRLYATDSDSDSLLAKGNAQSVTFSPDGKVFIAHFYFGSGDPLRRWSIPDQKELPGGWCGTHTLASSPTGPLAYSPDGSVFATVFSVLNTKGNSHRYESVVILWNVDTGEEQGRLTPAEKSAHASQLAFSPDGTLLAGIYGPDLMVWDVAARKEVARRKPSQMDIKGLAFTPDGSRLLTASNDESIRVWAAPNWAEATGYAWKIGKLGCVAVSADGTLAAAGGSTGKVVVWDLE